MTVDLTPQHPEHRPVILLVGSLACLDRDCDDYLTDSGEDDPGIERCSHITDETVCAGCSTETSEGYWEPTVPWADCPENPANAALLAEIRRLKAELARRVQCGDCGAVGDVDTAEDGRAYLYPSGQIGH